ncbi:hypothetical protein LPJ53_001166 [Coemansia erecta]|uniref:RNA helicase n=1 Tax=Coemansia erecta TaxID=147472 RepID=A0A9W7Y0J4_9FUNG|nr:hypothetical protein LPJ53_001166 [Coemansia erecta]
MILKFGSVKTVSLRGSPKCFHGKAAYFRWTLARSTSTLTDKASNQSATFGDLHIDRRLVLAAQQHLGVSQPTLMQQQLLATLHTSTSDLLLRHETGSGKTLAILLWLLTQALRRQETNPSAEPPRPYLFVVPNRELALQIEQWTRRLLSEVPGEPASVLQRFVSGAEFADEQQGLFERHGVPQVVLGTPRCLLDRPEYARLAGSAGCVVVDEVDAVLRLPGKRASDRQVRLRREKPRAGQLLVDRVVEEKGTGVRLVMASATANKELRRFLRRWTRDLQLVDLQAGVCVPRTLTHHCLVIEDRETIRNIREKEAAASSEDGLRNDNEVEEEEKGDHHYGRQGLLEQQKEYLQAAEALAEVASNVIGQMQPRRTLVFIRSDAPMREFLEHLADRGVRAQELVSRYAGQQAGKGGASGKQEREKEGSAVYLATEEAARGIDVEHVDLVLVLDVPRSPASYAHLAGRAGRFGRQGSVVSVVPMGAWGFYESKMRGMYKALGLEPSKLPFVE